MVRRCRFLLSTVLGCGLALALAAAAGCSDSGSAGPACGNGSLDPGEVCDKQALDGKTCEALGFGPGALACKPTCDDFDRGACSAPAGCGDGKLAAPEICDGGEHGGASCESLGLGPGKLSCQANCGGFDTTGCAAAKTCGNGKKDGAEVCDGKDLAGATCQSRGFDRGTLACLPNCTGYDETGCEKDCVPECGARVCGVDPVCGKPCGACDAQSVCEEPAGICKKICDLDALTKDTSIDFDPKTVAVSGTVTLDGKAMPDNGLSTTQQRGYLRFVRQDSGKTISVPLGNQGAASYQTTLYAGRYDVELDPRGSSYQDALPAYRIVLARDVDLAGASKTLDYDLSTITITGAVTLNGKQLADNGQSTTQQRGYLRFHRADAASSISAALGNKGAASYSLRVYKGLYRVTLEPRGASYQDVLPALTIVLKDSLDLQKSATWNFDPKTVTVTGKVELDGKPLADNGASSTQQRGYLRFIRADSASSLSVALGNKGAATYSVVLFAGTHGVTLEPRGSSYQDVLPPYVLPLAQSVAINTNTTLDYAPQTVQVTGAVTKNGKAMPDNGQSTTQQRGYLRFSLRGAGSSLPVALGNKGAASYTARIFRGRYDVQLEPRSASYQDALPPYQTVLARDVNLTASASAAKSFDAKTAQISGVVTKNGVVMPDNGQSTTQQRGYLRFIDFSSGSTYSVALGNKGAAAYATELYLGLHGVELEPRSSSYQDALPPITTILADAYDVTAGPLKKDFDAQTVQVDGELKLDGKPLADNTQSTTQQRGYLRFVSRRASATLATPLGNKGAASYAIELFAGSYDVDLDPRGSSYQDVLPPYRIKLRRGCFVFPACSKPKSDISGQWRMLLSEGLWGKSFFFSLQQSGGALSGSFDYQYGQGSVTGSISGDQLTIKFRSYCDVTVSATLKDGCAFLGTFRAVGCPGGITTAIVGTRLQ
jgi:hypothetical protein